MDWIGYGEMLDERLVDLHTRLRQQCYKPKLSLRMWIARENEAKQPIGITALEDKKIVQQALAWLLQSIYEEDFLRFSYVFH